MKWNKLKYLLLFLPLLYLTAAQQASGQELEVSVDLDYSSITSGSTDYLDNLPSEIEQYLNDTDWIAADYEPRERIEVTLQITLLGVDNDYNFDANLVVRSQRPIYNSLQSTTVLLFNDQNWTFRYMPNRTLIHDELRFDPLTTLLDFYAYLLLGLDYDTFEELGGSDHYSQAQNLVSLAQSGDSPGWERSGSQRNRAQIVTNLLNPSYRSFREALYRYHRLGIDRFLDEPEEARRSVLQALRTLQENSSSTTGDLLFDLFFTAKYRELASVFEDGSAQVRREAYQLLSELDPGHLGTYERLNR
ncbi:MAG: DUF4835 family protein [Balneolaceae bacterium]|nr:DUF4835 family protein [Balneolaceae bacterium]